MALVKAHRTHGHLAARLDPLGSEPVGDPSLEPLRLEPKLTPELQARIPASVLRVHVAGRDARRRPASARRDVLRHDRLRARAPLRPSAACLAPPGDRVRPVPAAARGRREEGALPPPLRGRGDGALPAQALPRAEAVLARGLDVMIPMLDETIELASEAGAHEVVLGMAHRGRLNVLAHTIGMPYEYILREFEGERTIEAVAVDPEGGTGDVKYHLGGERDAHDVERPGRRPARREPEPSRGGRPGGRGPHPRRADRPLDAQRRTRPVRRAAGAAARRRRVRRSGDRRRDVQPARSRGLLDRRHAAPDHEQPDRLHDRSERGPLDALLVGSREGLRRPDHPRQRRRSRGVDLRDPAVDGLPAPLRPGRRDRSRRLPALRSQRAGRGGVHAAADGRADQRASRPCASSTRSS